MEMSGNFTLSGEWSPCVWRVVTMCLESGHPVVSDVRTWCWAVTWRWRAVQAVRWYFTKTHFKLQLLPLSQHLAQLQLDCTQRGQTSAKASDFNQKWSGVRIRINRIGIQMSARSLTECCLFISLSDVGYFTECVEHWPVNSFAANFLAVKIWKQCS